VKSSLACVCTPMCSNCSRNDGMFLPGSLLCPGIKGCLSSSKWRLTRKGPNPVSGRCSNRLSCQDSSNSLLKGGGGGGAHVDQVHSVLSTAGRGYGRRETAARRPVGYSLANLPPPPPPPPTPTLPSFTHPWCLEDDSNCT